MIEYQYHVNVPPIYLLLLLFRGCLTQMIGPTYSVPCDT